MFMQHCCMNKKGCRPINLTESSLKQIDDPALDPNSRTFLRCRLAADLIFSGQYEDARAALGPLWQGIGIRPPLDELDAWTGAETLLQCGVLTGWLGSCQRLTGAQEQAKEMLGEALRRFESLAQPVKVSEAQYELGFCYWRQGALDEARVILVEALRGLDDASTELKAKILIRQTLMEVNASRYLEAWELLAEAEPFFERACDALKGRWHMQRALVLHRLATSENRADYADRSIIEFTAAIFHCEQAGHFRYCGGNLNNLAVLMYRLGRYAEAHDYLDRARQIYMQLGDAGYVAQVDDTRACALIAECRFEEAASVIAGAVRALREGGEMALAADALTVQGVAQARLGEHDRSISTLKEAMSVAETAGAVDSAGHAALSLIEEHGAARLPDSELYNLYRQADEMLARTQDAEDIARLRACARVVTERLASDSLSEGYSLPEAVRRYEARLIMWALKEAGGSISRAANRLGIKHQSLAYSLNARHPDLLDARTPAIPRRRSLIRLSKTRRRATQRKEREAMAVMILHVEDSVMGARAVQEVIELEGWQVEWCADGLAGLKALSSDARYDLLIFDYELPGMDGLELVRLARQLPHRQHIPIIMLSAGSWSVEARAAGVDAFLMEPGNILVLTDTAKELLAKTK